MQYELTLERFKGPMDALLGLIEERKLEISEINLGEITEDFLKFLQELQKTAKEQGAPDADLRLLADFIVIASRLILIKSKSLLPDLTLTHEEESQIKDLEQRLKLYQTIKPTMKLFSAAWNAPERSFNRPYFWNIFSASSGWGAEGVHFFYPGNGVNKEGMNVALTRLLQSLQTITHETETIREKVISLEAEMKSIVTRLVSAGNESLSHLSRDRSRAEIVVIFLAILHLVRDQLINVEQQGHFSDIMITHDAEKPHDISEAS